MFDMRRYYKIDMFGWFYVIALVLLYSLIQMMGKIRPTKDIDIVPSIKQNRLSRNTTPNDNNIGLQ